MNADPSLLEQQAIKLVTAVLDEYAPALRRVGLSTESPRLSRVGEIGSTYESEVTLYFYEASNVEDFLEFFVYRAGKPDTSLEAIESWLREMLDDLIYERGSKSFSSE